MSYRLRQIAFKILLFLFFSSQGAHVWHHLSEDTTAHQVAISDDLLTADFNHSCNLCQLVMEDLSFKPESFELAHFVNLMKPNFPRPHDYRFDVCYEQSGRDPPTSL